MCVCVYPFLICNEKAVVCIKKTDLGTSALASLPKDFLPPVCNNEVPEMTAFDPLRQARDRDLNNLLLHVLSIHGRKEVDEVLVGYEAVAGSILIKVVSEASHDIINLYQFLPMCQIKEVIVELAEVPVTCHLEV